MQLPFVFSIPHCGSRIPQALRSAVALDDGEILEAVDYGTREIFGRMPAHTVIAARWSRLVADLNRSPQQRGAKGVVALTDYHGRRVFKPGCEPAAEQIAERLRRYYDPYHGRLQLALPGGLALFDCHSMNGSGPADAPDAGQQRQDITLSNNGDRQGEARPGRGPVTCPGVRLRAIADHLRLQGFSVAINHPFQGGHIVNHYAPPLLKAGLYAVQIELNQGLYMPSGGLEPDPGRISGVTARLTRAFYAIADGLRT
jgi:N-formylglutamate deformylase